MLRDNLVGLIEPMQLSAGADPLALRIQKQASDDRSLCLENPRPEGAESSLTENVTLSGALAVFIVLYFASPAIPVVPKPDPLIDPMGHLLGSPANESEMAVLRLQDAIVETRQYMESEQYPESQKNCKRTIHIWHKEF